MPWWHGGQHAPKTVWHGTHTSRVVIKHRQTHLPSCMHPPCDHVGLLNPTRFMHSWFCRHCRDLHYEQLTALPEAEQVDRCVVDVVCGRMVHAFTVYEWSQVECNTTLKYCGLCQDACSQLTLFACRVCNPCRLCELNVLRQTFHVCTSPVVQAAWDRGQDVEVYGIVYSLKASEQTYVRAALCTWVLSYSLIATCTCTTCGQYIPY